MRTSIGKLISNSLPVAFSSFYNKIYNKICNKIHNKIPDKIHDKIHNMICHNKLTDGK